MNQKRRNGGRDYKVHIPTSVIVLAWFCSPPVGVILTLVKLFLPSLLQSGEGRERSGSSERSASSSVFDMPKRFAEEQPTSETEKTDQIRKGKKQRSVERTLAILFTILAAVLCLAGVINGVNVLKNGLEMNQLGRALRETLLGETMLMELFAAASFVAGRVFHGKHDRFMRIRSIIGNRDKIAISKLAAMADVSVNQAKKTLQKLINRGIFGEEAYLDLEKGWFVRSPSAEDMEETTLAAEDMAFDLETAQQEENYRAIILEIRRLNDEIRDFAVSERIYRIEEHTQNIFDYVTEHPEAKGQIRTFMNYYLPTTLKLLESYSRIEKVGVAGENMKKSKENIENILDMLVVGFEQQVDQLFRNESMDIDSEISVLETMMKQDGLSGKSDFSEFSDTSFGGAAAQSPADTDKT